LTTNQIGKEVYDQFWDEMNNEYDKTWQQIDEFKRLLDTQLDLYKTKMEECFMLKWGLKLDDVNRTKLCLTSFSDVPDDIQYRIIDIMLLKKNFLQVLYVSKDWERYIFNNMNLLKELWRNLNTFHKTKNLNYSLIFEFNDAKDIYLTENGIPTIKIYSDLFLIPYTLFNDRVIQIKLKQIIAFVWRALGLNEITLVQQSTFPQYDDKTIHRYIYLFKASNGQSFSLEFRYEYSDPNFWK